MNDTPQRALRRLCVPILAFAIGWGTSACSADAAGDATGGATGGASGLAAVEWINTDVPPTAPGALAGKALVVEFWATWCPPCRSSTPHLVELANAHAQRGLVVLGVHVARSLDRDEVERFIEQYDIPYAIGLDRSGAYASSHGVSGIPDAFVYDRGGELVWRGHPMDPAFDQALAQALE